MKNIKRKIDPITTIIPLAIILLLCCLFVIAPGESSHGLKMIRGFLEGELGIYYLAVGLGVLLISLYIAFSDIGKIILGKPGEKPQYSFFTWGAMMFTAGLAADILFYSFCEWILYAGETHIEELGSIQDWASTYPLFHWGPVPWSFYAVLAACFGFMLHIRGVKKQKYSEACRPILGRYTDKIPGKIIDILAVIALIAGTSTTFSLATPLLSVALTDLFGIEASKWVTIAILITICVIYTVSVLHGMKGVKFLAQICMYVFFALLIYVLVFGKRPIYIMETGFSAVGNLLQNFIKMSTWTDALRTSSFPQNWTIFYWAYWMVWCVAAPFFMGSISKGRSIKQVVLGAYVFGLSSTFISFIILGNYGLGLQTSGTLDLMAIYADTGNLYQTILAIVHTLPVPQLVLIILIVSMVAFYATSFDSITLVASAYSYKEIKGGEDAGKGMKLFWAILLIMLPIVLIFSENSMNNLQTLSMIAAFPVGIVILLIIASFIKDAKRYFKETDMK
ncbi:MAG: BCCT family transporter [Lachnospiraceae bacterium]|jgi:BCCT family betaine/carnitine transporter|nr:BCCT family transporter [Lachnospiraceae bacterium]